MVISLSENGSPFFLSGECLGKYNLCICVFGGVCVCVFKVFYDREMVPSPGKVMQGPFSGSHWGEGIFLQGLPV